MNKHWNGKAKLTSINFLCIRIWFGYDWTHNNVSCVNYFCDSSDVYLSKYWLLYLILIMSDRKKKKKLYLRKWVNEVARVLLKENFVLEQLISMLKTRFCVARKLWNSKNLSFVLELWCALFCKDKTYK